MSTIIQVVLFSLAGGLVSLIGGFLLLADKSNANKLSTYATPFAAGALLAAAFVDLLREASHQGSIDTALTFTLVGILGFFMLERFLHWFHHHHEHVNKKTDPTATLIIIGDTIHNFIDGVAIAAGFLVNPSTGVIVTLAVAAHEIPQEIGDFGLLLKKGLRRKSVILINLVSSFATLVAAVTFFQLGQSFDLPFDVLLGLVAGFFIYIAVSDIIPEIHKSEDKKLAGWQSVILLVGAVVVGLLTTHLHGYIDQGHEHDHSHETHESAEEHHDHDHHEEKHSDNSNEHTE